MASGQLAGTYFLARGSSPSQYTVLGEGDSAVFDNAIGSDPYYINGIDMPGGDEGAVLNIGEAPHVGPGENLYAGVKSTTQDGLDSDDTLAVLFFQIAEYTLNGTFVGTILWRAVGDRNTTVGLGGFADDPFVNIGVPALAYARGPCPAGRFWKLYGRTQLDIRDDTV